MSAELVQRSVSFYGDDLVVIHQDGVEFTPVKPVCDILGIDWNGQYQRIMRDEILSSVMCVTHIPSAGGSQQMVCLPLDFLNGWLFGVSADRIKPENRDNLKRYKLECYRALSRAFGGQPPSAELAALEARVAALEARPPRPARQLGERRADEAQILARLEITQNPADMQTLTEIAAALAAEGLHLGDTPRAQQMAVAGVLRRQGVGPARRRAAERVYGRLVRAWAGVRVAVGLAEA